MILFRNLQLKKQVQFEQTFFNFPDQDKNRLGRSSYPIPIEDVKKLRLNRIG